MNSKRIISLILSIIMTLQVFVFQTPVHAMEGASPTTQKSEGQKTNERTEEFAFKNTKKSNLSWFNAGTMSTYRARSASTTRTETLKIETTAKGLDNGEKAFDWEAFGQNKKFRAWIEVAYEEDKKPGEKVASGRNKVSKDFEISSEGNIDAEVTLDASKTVDYYYLMTEYDNNDSLVKINAIFDYKNSFSPKDKPDLTFKIGIQQIVSTTITYNLVDEYGKAIDLNDAKEEKPEDTDLKNLAKFGKGTDDPLLTFNLKNKGTEILREEKIDDEDELIDSSIKLIVEEKSITSAGIEYKLTSTYDVLNGGTVTIQRQKDAVTPKDPKNPGDIPEGYARIKLSADALGGKTDGTFTKDDPQDTQRVVDVKAGKAYSTAQAEVDKVTKPFPLTSEKKVDTGKVFDKWTPALSEFGTAVAKETKNLNATYKSSDVEIIPYLPDEEVPTKDKDGLPIPTDYVTVTFKSESETKGKVKIGDKEGATVLAKVKPGIDLSKKAEITTVPKENYGFTEWKPVLGKAAEGQSYTAHFVKSGDKINEGDPIPKDWFKVTVSQDEDSIKSGTVTKAVYTVKPNDKLGQDKFANLEGKANDGFKDPAWYVGSEKLEKPYEKEITTSTDFIARATEEIANKFKTNGLKAVDITAYKGDKIEGKFWNKGVTVQREDAVLERLIEAATVTDITETKRTTDNAGTFPGTLKVTFEDGSSLEVQNQKLIVIDTKIDIDYDKDSKKDANAPRHKDEVVKGRIKSDEALEGAKVEILGTNAEGKDEVIGITLAKADGSFIAGTRKLQAGEKIKVRVTLPKAGKASEPVEKTVKLNADRLKDLLPIAKAQKENFSKKQNAFIKQKLDDLNTAITEAEKLVDKNYKAVGEDTAKNQTAIDNAVTALEKALKELTANIPPTISGPKTHEIFVGEALDLKALVDVTDGDGADDLVEVNGSKVKVEVKKVEEGKETSVTNLSTINTTVGTYKVTYTAKDKSDAEVTHEMTLTVKPRTNSAIEVTTDPTTMSYLITEKDGKAQLNLDGMTLNLVDNLGDKTKVDLTDTKVKFKVNGKEIKNGGDLTLADDVHFIEVEYTPEGSQTPLTAKTDGVLRVGPDYDKDGKDDRTQDFDEKNISKLEVIKQPKLDYIAKDKSEADEVFKLNLDGMIVRMTDKAGKEKLAVVKEGKFYDYDEQTKEIKGLTATPAHGATLTPETAENAKGDNGKTVKITGPNNSEAFTEPLKVFYDANKDGNPDHGKDQKTPAPSAMARNLGEKPEGTTVEGMATPGAVIKITDKDGTVLTTEPEKVIAGPDGKYTATIKPILADGTDIKVTAKLGEMGESDPTPTTVFDDKNNNKQPDRDEGFNIAKATDIKFVDQPDLTYLVPSKDKEVTFDGKDGKGKAIYLELSYKNGDKTESKIMTLEDLMKDTEHIAVTPAKGTTDKKENQAHDLVGKNLEVKLVKADKTATSTSTFAIEIDADKNGKADKDEKTPAPTAKALNVGKDPKSTTITGAAVPGAKVVAKVGETVVGEATVPTEGENAGKYTIEAKKDGVALPVDTKVEVTAQVGEKQPSDPTEAIVKEDKDGNGTPDNEQGFDITKAAKIEMVSDPNKMDYLVTTQDGTVKFEANGMLVRVTDKAGKEKLYTAEELAADTTNFTVAPANGVDLTIAANHDKKVKVTLKTAPADMTTKEVETSRALSIKLDANNNGIADDQEVFDITKATKVEIIKNPDKMNYSVKEKTDKTPFDAKGLMIRLTDDSGKTATYTYDDIMKAENNGKFTLSPADKEQIGLKEDGSVNTIPFKVTVTGAETKPSVTAEQNITVILDKDGNGVDDRTEKTAEPDVIARNIGKDPQKTTVEIETQPKAKVTIEYTDKDGQAKKIENLTAGEDGKLTQEITPKLEKDTPVKVTVKDGEKQPTEKTVKVFDDLDNNKIPDTQAGQTERPAALASNIGKKPEFTTITGEAEKGATVTAYVGTEVVGTATADPETGKYTIQAKQNDAPIKQGVKIDVTAILAPKTESLKQTVVVFNDTDGTGQPDSAKDFDVKKTTGMQVVASPDKMVYSDGDKLNLDGLKVLLTDVNGHQKIFTYKHADNTEFTKAGLSVDLKQDTELSSKDYNAQTAKDGHNGRKLVVTLDTTGNTQVTEAITGQTPTALTVNKNQSAQPTDLVAANQADEKVTKVKGKATKDAEIKITDANGKSLLPEGKTIKADANGDFTADLSKLLDPGTKVFVTATEPGKSESPKAETPVIRDKDGDWKADTGSKLSTPVIDPIREKDEKVVVAAPKADDKIQIIEVSDQNGNTVTLTKDSTGNTWTVVGSDPVVKVKEEGGKIAIPVKDKLPLNDRDQIKVTFRDGENPANEAFDKAPVQKASQTPIVDPVYTGDKSVKIADPTVADPTAKTIKVKVNDKDSIVIEKQDDNSWKVKDNPNAKVEVKDGKVIVPLDPSAKKDDVIKVSTINDSKVESPQAEVKVVDKEKSTTPTVNPVATNDTKITGTAGPNADVVITITPKDGGTPKEIVTKADKDGNFSVPAEGLKDGDTIVAKATEKDKAPAESAPVTVGVDKTKLINAIDDGNNALDPDKGGRNDGTPADKALEKAIEEGKKVKDNPDATQKDVNEKTKAIEDAIKEKEETDKALDELKKAKEELDKTIEDAEADEKPNEAIDNGRDASDDADTVINNKGEGKTAAEIKELVEKTKEENRILRLPAIQVTINTAVNNGNDIVFTTNPGRCKVTITITRKDRSKETFNTETGPGGTGSISLDKPLQSGETVKINATRITDSRPDPDFLDNYTSTRV